MQTVNMRADQVLSNALNKPMAAISSSMKLQDNSRPMPTRHIAMLWLQLTEIYAARFVNQYGEKDNGAWQQALGDLTEDDIRFGINAMMRDIRFETWPPNCTQFRHLCKRPEAKCLPNVHRAFAEARDKSYAKPERWSHPAVKFTVKHLGIDVVKSAHTYEAYTAFSALYARVCLRVEQGHQIPFVADEELVRVPVKKNIAPKLSQLIR